MKSGGGGNEDMLLRDQDPRTPTHLQKSRAPAQAVVRAR